MTQRRAHTLSFSAHRSGQAVLPLWLALVATLVIGTLAQPANAQEQTFYLDRLQISGAPDDGFAVWRPYVYPKTRVYAGTALGYTLNPLRGTTVAENNNGVENPVKNQLITYLSAGIQAKGRFSFNIALPIALFQNGGADPIQQGVGSGLNVNPVAVHDLRFDGRVKVFESDNEKLRLGAGGAFWVPTGNATSFAGDDQASAYLYGAGEYDFGPFFLSGTLGPHFRGEGGIEGDNSALTFVGSELRYNIGIFFPLRDDELRLGATLWGTTGIEHKTFFRSENTDLEWLAQVRMPLTDDKRVFFMGGGGTRLTDGYGAPDIRLLASIGAWTEIGDVEPGQTTRKRRAPPDVAMRDKDTDGDGYPDDIDMCPTIKEDGKPPDPSDGCPAPKDSDGDGIIDSKDKCPNDPEDKDGVEDHDGCPETDADRDGILDVEDDCPTVAGVEQDVPDKNGCPKERKRIIETEGEIQLLEAIQFETGKSTIKPVSYPILDEVVDVMKSRPDIRIAVHGHTDSRGSKALNERLSKDRAAAVVRYLVSKGIKRSRLESEGFGPNKPIASNETAEGRAKNRRVEFKIIE